MPEQGERIGDEATIEASEPDIYRPDLSREGKIQRQTERMKTKLYIPRKVDGEPSREEMQIIREIEERLSGHPAFIGVSIFGSSITGYGDKTPDSDVDVKLIYDESKFKDKDLEDKIKFLEIVKSIFPNGASGPNFINGKKVHFFREIAYIDQIERDFKSYLREYYPEHFLIHIIAEMSKIITSDKINEYRVKIAKLLHDLPEDKRDRLIDLVVDFLSEADDKSLAKRRIRMPEITEQIQQEILKKRKEMWRKRVEKIWRLI